MALSEITQAKSLLEKAHRVLLIVPENASLDAVASMVALYVALQDIKEDAVDEVCAEHVPAQLQFLSGSSQVLMAPQQSPEIVVDIAGPTEIISSRAVSQSGGVRVHLGVTPGAELERGGVEVTIRQLPYDAVVVLGALDLEALGQAFSENVDFFYNVPIINIDHRSGNEHFGTVNLVDITAGSVAEVTYSLITALLQEKLAPDVATALYAGIVAGTDQFQRPATTPRSFSVAARLMESEADRESVIQHLVKTKPLSLLKLTGRLYARLRYDEHLKLFWSLVNTVDFTESRAALEDVPRALDELSNNISSFNIAFVVSSGMQEKEYVIYLLLGKGLRQQRDAIAEQLSANKKGHVYSWTMMHNSIEEAEAAALDQVRSVVPH